MRVFFQEDLRSHAGVRPCASSSAKGANLPPYRSPRSQQRLLISPTEKGAGCSEATSGHLCVETHREAIGMPEEGHVELARKERTAVLADGVHLEPVALHLLLNLVAPRARPAQTKEWRRAHVATHREACLRTEADSACPLAQHEAPRVWVVAHAPLRSPAVLLAVPLERRLCHVGKPAACWCDCEEY